MTPFVIVILLLATGLEHIQGEQPQNFQGYPLWRKNADVVKFKEIKLKLTEEFLPVNKDDTSVEEWGKASSEEVHGGSSEEQMKTNKMKREIDPNLSKIVSMESIEARDGPSNNVNKFNDDDVSMSSSSEYKNSGENSEELSKLVIMKSEEPKISTVNSAKLTIKIGADKSKRQTSIKGNGNRLSNLVNLPVKLDVLANVLSSLNLGVLGDGEAPTASNTIIGNDNTISSLVNAPIDVNAVLNILSKVDNTGSPAGPGSEKKADGLVGNLPLVGGLLGGGSKGGLVGGVLGSVGNIVEDVESLLGDVLGNTLGDLFGALLGKSGLVGNLLGGLEGTGLVTDVLDNLLGGVGNLVENLLHLLVGLLEGLLKGLETLPKDPKTGGPLISDGKPGSPGLKIEGNNNRISSLINAPIRLKAVVNALSTVKQVLAQDVVPSTASTLIQGNKNEISSLINLPIDANVKANVLSSVVEEVVEKSEGTANGNGGLLSSLLGSGGTSIKGDKNVVSSLLNVAPDIDLNVNLLSSLTELLGAPAGGDVTTGSNPNEICFDIPISQADTSIVGNDNKISNTINVKPKINLDLNLLSTIKKTGGSLPSNVPTQRICIPKPTGGPKDPPVGPIEPPPTVKPPVDPLPPTKPGEICFDIFVDQSGTIISGDNNQISSLVNVDPKINVGLNLLSNVQQQAPPPNFVRKRICIDAPVTAKPIEPPTVKPTVKPPVYPITTPAPPLYPTNPDEICFDVFVDQSGTIISGNNNHISSLINVDPKINLGLNLLSNVQQQAPQTNLIRKRICIPAPVTPLPPTQKPVTYPPDRQCFRRTCTRWRQFLDRDCLLKPEEYPKYTYTQNM